ncbi:MAG: SCO family protein, partial [Crocinitomicaceae bacterium]
MKIRFSVFFLILIGSACSESKDDEVVDDLPYYNEATFTPKWLSSNSPILDTFHQIPNFKLVNQDGLWVTEKTFENKIYVVDFFFTTCPGICPKMTTNMSLLQSAFIDDSEVLLLSHSVTPIKDSVQVLKDYAISKGIVSKKWHLVTGKRSEIYKLGRRAYFIEEDLGMDKTDEEFLHTENFVLIDQNKH